MLKIVFYGIVVMGLMVGSFKFGQSWELSKTAQYCQSVGKVISGSGPAYCVDE
ncbi:hypothetical protein [Escherichia coli]|uniref:hypothetical protein n=1 Tax=Escherichia coli TaxID=562 RepID=UPI0018E45D96|nr:hypothetical protein [Escherichia coli]